MTTTEADLFRSYQPTTVAADHLLRVLVQERVAELWSWRSWYRQHAWADWSYVRTAQTVELRALVKLLRQCRDESAPDPIDAYKGWSESEKAGAFGR
jgi:hypothetical protein